MAGRPTFRGRVAVCAVAMSALLMSGMVAAPHALGASGSRPGPHHPGPSGSASSTADSSPHSTATALGTGSSATAPAPSIGVSPNASIVQAATQGVAAAAADGVTQSVAVVDRSTGMLVADIGGEQIYNTESLTKLFTAAYYLEQEQGTPDPDLTDQLSRMIELSDDDIQSSLWRSDIVPTVAQRYGLTGTGDPTDATDGDWGSDRTTADDMVTYLLRASQDPWVGSSVLAWMAAAQPTGADGFDQDFGMFGLVGGVKQGWSDPDWEPRNVHSVGWTDRYFVAILQTSPTASFDTLRATSTATAQLLVGPGAPATGTSAAESTPTTSPSPSPGPNPVGSADATGASSTVATVADLLADLGRSIADLVKHGLQDALRL